MAWGSRPSLGAALLGEGTAGHVVERARAAERAGLDSLWFIEDYFQTGAFALAGAAAAVTARIAHRPGRGQSATRATRRCSRWRRRRSPASRPGRVVLGLGTGRPAVDRGPDARSPRRGRSPRSRECVDVVRRLWAGERVTPRGRRASRSRDVALEFKPAQAALPIVLGVKGPRALGLAGAVADGVRVLDHVLARPRAPRARDDGRGAQPGRPRGPVPDPRLRAGGDRP